MTIGTAINTLPAANRANSVSSRLISPTATVYRSFSLSRSFGRIKSLHGQVKEESAVYTMIGFDNGRLIFVNT